MYLRVVFGWLLLVQTSLEFSYRFELVHTYAYLVFLVASETGDPGQRSSRIEVASRDPIVFNFQHPLRDLFRFDTPSDFVKVNLIEPAKEFLTLFQAGLPKFAETKRRSFTTHSYVKVSAISFERLRIINATDNTQLSDYLVKFSGTVTSCWS